MATQGVPLWSTTASNNGSSDPAVNFAEGQAPSTVNDSARGLMASVAKWRNDLYGITTGGSGTAFTATTGSTFASASDMSGVVLCIIPHTTSGASPTLAVDSLTARAINISTGVAVPTGALVEDTPYLVKYVHASTEFIVIGSLGKNLLTAIDIIGGTQETSIATDDTLPIYDLSGTSNKRMLVSDFLKVVNALTADSSPDGAADYVMTYDESASDAKKVLLQNMPGRLPRGYIDGCILSNGTDATNDINIAAGVCRDSTNAVDMVVPALSGKQLDANWALGGTAGMRNSAAGITDTTYHLYAVRTAASSTADVYAHTSTTVATVLTALQAETGGSDYIYARRIGSITRVSSAITGFVQHGDVVWRKVAVLDASAVAISTTVTDLTLSVPLGIRVEAIVNGFATNLANATNIVHLYPTDVADTAITNQSGPGSTGAITNTGSITDVAVPTQRVLTDTSGQISALTNDAGGNIRLWLLGYVDLRGKDS